MRYIAIILLLFNVASAQSLFGVVASDGGLDSNARRFIIATGITDATQKRAVNYLCRALKDSSLWSKMSVVYPMVGGTSRAHSFNLKDTATFKITFENSPTHDANGVNFNGTNQRALTGFTPSDLNNSHLSYYTKTNNTTGTQIPIGAINLTGSVPFFQLNITGANFYIGTQIATFTNTNTQGYYIGSRTSTTSLIGYKNGTQVASSTSANTSSTIGVQTTLGARRRSDSTYDFYSVHQCAFSSIGDGLNSTEARALNNIVTQYQTLLGRQN